MLQDFDAPGCHVPDHSDVCVVGAGAAGILVATQLATKGCFVTLLEGGGRHQESRSQRIYRSELTGHLHEGVHLGRNRTLGGTTTQWGGQILELPDSNFENRRHVEGSGWPILKSELEAYYERALDFVGLQSAEREDGRVRETFDFRHDVGPEFSLLYSRHCPKRNFASVHEATLANAERLSVILHANVIGVVLNQEGSAIRSVKVVGFDGRRAEITAEHFVICAGGIETTRLLLQPTKAGKAPWQANGLLGHHFQDHILLDCIPLYNLTPQPARRYYGCTWIGGFQYRPHIRLSAGAQAANETLDVAGTINPFQRELKGPERASRMLRKLILEKELPLVASVASDAFHLPGVVRDIVLRRVIGEEPAWSKTMLTLHCEQSPSSSSTISLSDRQDKIGMFVTRLNWHVSDQEIHTLRTYIRLAANVFSRNGLAEVRAPKGFLEDDAVIRAQCGDSYHHMGGTRMSLSPSNGVVDTDLKLHGVANGYVCSTSVFPTSGFSNPTHTLLALAMRLSDHLAEVAKRSTRAEEVPARDDSGTTISIRRQRQALSRS